MMLANEEQKALTMNKKFPGQWVYLNTTGRISYHLHGGT